jgi:hypothetical protein
MDYNFEVTRANSRLSAVEDVVGGFAPSSKEFSVSDAVRTVWLGDMDYSDWAFGFSISGAVVTVMTGKVRQGTRAPVTVAQTNITIAADQTWIYVEYAFGGTSATVTSHLTEPQTNPTTLRYPLHLWSVSGGTVSIARILHLGDIVIPGVFA